MYGKKLMILSAVAFFFLLFNPAAYSSLSIISPVRGSAFSQGDSVTITWEKDSGNVSLDYSTDGGKKWQIIAAELELTSYTWQIPDISSLIIRVSQSSGYNPSYLFSLSSTGESEFRSVQFSPDGKYLLSCGRDSGIRIWNIAAAEPEVLIDKEAGKSYFDASYTNSGDTVLFAADSSITAMSTGNAFKREYGRGEFNNIVRHLAVNPCFPVFAGGSYDGTCRLFGFDSVHPFKNIVNCDTSEIYCTIFSRDGTLLAASGYDGIIRIYDWQSGQLVSELTGHGENGQNLLVWTCDISPGNKYLISGGVDRTVRLWDIENGSLIKTMSEHTGHVRCVKYSPDGRLFFSASLDNRLFLRNSGNNEITDTFDFPGQIITASFSLSGDTLAICGRSDEIAFWRLNGGITDFDTVSLSILTPQEVIISEEKNLFPVKVSVFPNPAGNILNINADFECSSTVKIEISDISGNRSLRSDFPGGDGRHGFIIDVSPLISGIYYLKIFSGNYYGTCSFLINK